MEKIRAEPDPVRANLFLQGIHNRNETLYHKLVVDYIAEIAVEMTGERSGQMIWSMYFDTIEGQEFKRILPIVLPAINEASLTKLALILGGELISCVHDFSGLEADV